MYAVVLKKDFRKKTTKILRKFSITAVFRCAVILEAAAGVVL